MVSGGDPRRALVTGGTGFLGRHLVDQLVAAGYHVMVASRPEPMGVVNPSATYRLCDVRDSRSIAGVLDEAAPTVVFHLAGLARGDDLADLMTVNVLGTQTVLNLIRHLPRPPVVVLAGSASEYGLLEDLGRVDESTPLRPLSDYGVSKAAQSLLGQAYALRGEVPVVIGRVFNITGPGEPTSMLCGALAAQIAACEAGAQAPILRVGNLSPVRDYLDVRDAARALWLLTLHGQPGAVYNICSGQPQRVEDVVRQLVALSRKQISVIPDPDRQRPCDVPQCVGDPGRLKRETGWSAQTPLADSLQATLEWWRAEHARTTTLTA